MKKESFAIILLSLILSATGCEQQAHDETSETPAAGSQEEGVKISQDTDVQAPIDADNSKDSNALNSAEVPKDDGHVSAQNTDELPNIDTDKPCTVQLSDGEGTNQIKSDKVFVHYCHEETCPCGDAACSQNSYCIMNTCIKFFEAAKPNSEEITQEELDNLDVTYCEEGNCPCGEGFCSKGSYCIIDTCICGDLKDCIDDNIISNNYGEFECYTQYAEESEESEESEEECQGCGCDEYKANEPQVLYRDFICTRNKGCKTADGREFERTKSDGDDYERDYIALDSEYSHSACQKYAKLKQEYELREDCGEKLFPEPEYLYPDGDFSPVRDHTYSECDLRKEFKRSGITKEHLSEYAWFIGKDYYYPCGSGAPFNTEYHDMLVGLRCIHPEGCVCGNTHCPEHSLCKDGACTYDLYYQHRVCPGDKWDPDESDSTNYILSIGEPCNCDDEDYEDYKDVCYDDCYWDLYDSKMTRDDPCIPKENTNQNPESEGHQPFKFTITTDIKPENKEVTIPILPRSLKGKYPVKYDLDCDGNGEYEYTGLTINATCKYSPNTGKHQISVRGDISAINLCDDDSDSGEAVISVDSWGDFRWKSMNYFAHKCKNLVKLPQDAPNLSEVTDMSSMFEDASSFNQSIEHWDVSNVTDMSHLFSGAESFNQPLEKWNVSNVTDMSRMFTGAKSFNQPLEKWNVSNVTNMSQMFSAAVAFNQPLEQWNVSNVTNMSYMFGEYFNQSGAASFNQPLETWDVSNVTDMSHMFDGAVSFNQPLEKWNISNVTDIGAMFRNARSFNQPLENWNISKVTSLFWVFQGAQSFNQPLEKWDTSNVTSLHGMFDGAVSFNQPIEKWNVSNVRDMQWVFVNAISFNQPLEKWNVSRVTYMTEMFDGAKSFNHPLEKWDVSNVEAMFAMFRNARSFNQPLEKWNVSKVTSMNEMFSGAVSFNQPLENWDVSNVTSMGGMFEGAKSFDQPLGKWNVSNVTFMMYMFKGASSFSHYPQNWVIPGKYAGEMFTGTRIEQLAKDKPLQKKDVDE